MPQIVINALPAVLNEMQIESLKGFLREACQRLFSTSELELDWRNFGFAFPVLGIGSELTHDAVVNVRLAPFPERLAMAPVSAVELHAGILDTIYGARGSDRKTSEKDYSVGVYLDFGTEIVFCDENGPI